VLFSIWFSVFFFKNIKFWGTERERTASTWHMLSLHTRNNNNNNSIYTNPTDSLTLSLSLSFSLL
jgi:hypothetical protein